MNRFFFTAVTAAPVIILLLSLTSCPAEGALMLDEAASTFAEIRQTVNEIKDTASGLWRFWESISSVVQTIAGLIDPRALALLFFVLLSQLVSQPSSAYRAAGHRSSFHFRSSTPYGSPGAKA